MHKTGATTIPGQFAACKLNSGRKVPAENDLAVNISKTGYAE